MVSRGTWRQLPVLSLEKKSTLSRCLSAFQLAALGSLMLKKALFNGATLVKVHFEGLMNFEGILMVSGGTLMDCGATWMLFEVL